ncbi:hypothetical protein TWF128_002292, partial [Orbilia oligospora]
MAKRGATEQITKDTWERDEDDGGRDRSEEPAEVASQAVLAKRKILKPKSRVGGISAAAPGPSPASSGLFNFGPPATTNSTPTTSLFGQLAQTTPSKNLFGQPVPLSSTPAGNPFSASKSENSLFPNLFGTPMPSEVALTTLETAVAKPATAVSTPQVASSIFGAPAPQLAPTHPVTTAVTATPPTFVFGAPSSQTTKPGPSIFAASTLAQGPTGAIAEPQKNLFGFPAQKPQEVVEAVPSSTTTTPTVTPAKPPLFGSFGDSAAVKPSDGSEPRSKILFGAPPHLPILSSNLEEGGENEKTSIFNTGDGSLASSSMQPSSRSLFPDFKVANPQSASAHVMGLFKTPTMMGPSEAKDISEDVAKSKQPKHDPKSLIPPPGVGVTKQDMPTFNWLYQVKSLNLELQDRIQEALSKDPFTNLTGFIDYYQDNLTYIDSVKLSQEGQLDEKAETEADNRVEGTYETK